jgi:GDP-4-dehydro-6-deoxy-D-mannose reductase
VLVTGAAGFVGQHLTRHLAGSGAGRVVGWARNAPPAGLVGLIEWQQIDLLSRDDVRRALTELRPAAIYHCAGMAHVAESGLDSSTSLAANVLTTHYLLDGLHRANTRCRVLIPGSAMVYAPSQEPLHERAALRPASPYALSKLAQEQLGARAAGRDGLEIVLTRSFNHTGPGQAPTFAAPGFARQIALIERGQQPPVIHVGNLDARRDLTDVRDVVRAYSSLMALGSSGTIYNVASGVGRTIGSVLEALLSRARVAVRVEQDAARLRTQDPSALVGNPARLREATGWEPLIPFERMLDDLLDYWRAAVCHPAPPG